MTQGNDPAYKTEFNKNNNGYQVAENTGRFGQFNDSTKNLNGVDPLTEYS